MNATEARTLSESKQLTAAQVLDCVKNATGHGDTMILLSNIHEDSIRILLQKGYKISKHTDPIGMIFTRIEW